MQPQRRGVSYYVSCVSHILALAFPKQEAGAEAMKLEMEAQKSSSVSHGILLSTNIQLNVNRRKLVRRS